MAPARSRNTNDDSKHDHSHKSNNYAPASHRNRKNGASLAAPPASNKDTASSTSSTAAGPNGTHSTGSALQWPDEGLETLQSYRNAYRLETPSAFKSPITASILTAPGVARYSPTMARKREKRKVAKEQLALAVRKHFNSVAVNETEVITDFVYAAKNQERSFKLRFAPSKPKHN